MVKVKLSLVQVSHMKVNSKITKSQVRVLRYLKMERLKVHSLTVQYMVMIANTLIKKEILILVVSNIINSQVRVNQFQSMDIHMKVNLVTMLSKVLVKKSSQMVQKEKVSMLIIYYKVKAQLNIPMVMFTQVTLKVVLEMVKVKWYLLIRISILVCSKMVYLMVWVHLHGLMEIVSLVYSRMAKQQVKVK